MEQRFGLDELRGSNTRVEKRFQARTVGVVDAAKRRLPRALGGPVVLVAVLLVPLGAVSRESYRREIRAFHAVGAGGSQCAAATIDAVAGQAIVAFQERLAGGQL